MLQRPGVAAQSRANAVSLNGFQTTRCRLQAKIITRNLEIFGDVSAWNIEPEPIHKVAAKRQERPPRAAGPVENAAPRQLIRADPRRSGGYFSSDDECDRKSNVFHRAIDARFFADFFSLESISLRYST
ncbi:hypothetical protein C5O80_09060 [Burkholderia sp. SRS-46]|nr:hypothetical protein C5O80_09060 [Burkholderia sp. SRS-46]